MGKYIDKILDRPIVSTIAFLLLDFIIMAIFAAIFENIIGSIIPTSEIIINSIATIIVTIIFLCIYIRYMRGKLKNLISTKNLKFALILIIPSFITVLLNIVSNIIEGSLDFSFLIILVGITAPFTEEVIFRGFIISNLMRIKKSKNLSIYLIVALSALPFGLGHLFNIMAGATITYAILQAFITLCLGVLYAAVYLRTGNLIAPIIAHGLMDISALVDSNLIGVSNISLASQIPSSIEIISTIIVAIIVLSFGLYYVRKEKWEDIDKTWNEMIIE